MRGRRPLNEHIAPLRIHHKRLRPDSGGQDGMLGVLKINGEKVDPKRQNVLKAGDTVSLATPSGGHGDPALRRPAAKAADLANGWMTPAS